MGPPLGAAVKGCAQEARSHITDGWLRPGPHSLKNMTDAQTHAWDPDKMGNWKKDYSMTTHGDDLFLCLSVSLVLSGIKTQHGGKYQGLPKT